MASSYFNMLREITLADFKLRYYDSVLGIVWVFAKPFLMFAVLFTVFSFLKRFEVANYAWFLLLGIIIWNFFSDATSKSILNMRSKSEFIKKIAFPREIIVYSACLNSLITFALNILAYVVLALLFGGPLNIGFLLLIIPATQILIFATGISFFLSVLFVKARDIAHIWEVFLRAFFWLTPIVYPLAVIPEKYRTLIFLNPLVSIINTARELALYNTIPPLFDITLVFGVSIVVFVLGIALFNRQSKYFAEEL
ncbi:MAG: hypothetical protein CL943_04090 [Candidatus Diapherotrites archaeon]|uniref:ABC transmembrane type-2 domain-containing protein n=1 Tax=Candidatus Iainarchaeum sp. TaxID=3101447 RepID=A0A2D6M1Z0_9ARCH|nr:hypothetical protein [Candidatus Diapherotrites archaeon]|tara:strand:+ start:875 stop:1633 length:759 start_codon:yes stop_codon:yes gene_type:complete